MYAAIKKEIHNTQAAFYNRNIKWVFIRHTFLVYILAHVNESYRHMWGQELFNRQTQLIMLQNRVCFHNKGITRSPLRYTPNSKCFRITYLYGYITKCIFLGSRYLCLFK